MPSGRPVLTTAEVGAAGIVSRSRLHLIGLDFQLRPKSESPGIVNLIDADATIEDCRFNGHHRPDIYAADKTSRVIELRGGGTLEVLDSAINIGHGDADRPLRSRPEHHLPRPRAHPPHPDRRLPGLLARRLA